MFKRIYNKIKIHLIKDILKTYETSDDVKEVKKARDLEQLLLVTENVKRRRLKLPTIVRLEELLSILKEKKL